MKSVGEFWFRIGIGVVLLLLWIAMSFAGSPLGGVIFLVPGVVQIAWTVISAQRIVRKAQRVEGHTQES